MNHEHKSEITNESVEDAKDGHPFLPSIAGLAIKTLLAKVTSAETRKYNPEMEVIQINPNARKGLNIIGLKAAFYEKLDL